MSRPATHEDLSNYQRQGSTVATIHWDALPKKAAMLKAVAGLVDAATALKLTLTEEYQQTQISLVKSTEELDAALANEQRYWDQKLEKLEKVINDPSLLADMKSYDVSNLASFAREEGYDSAADNLDVAYKEARIREVSAS